MKATKVAAAQRLGVKVEADASMLAKKLLRVVLDEDATLKMGAVSSDGEAAGTIVSPGRGLPGVVLDAQGCAKLAALFKQHPDAQLLLSGEAAGKIGFEFHPNDD